MIPRIWRRYVTNKIETLKEKFKTEEDNTSVK